MKIITNDILEDIYILMQTLRRAGMKNGSFILLILVIIIVGLYATNPS